MKLIDVHQLADSARFNRFHAKVLFWCLAIIIIDGNDIAVAGAALPSIMSQMGVTAQTAGFMASSALFGMMFGAIFLGALSDRIGRRPTIAICVALFSIFTAGAGFTSDPVSFSVMRFIAGLGIGGVMPNIVAQMTEYAPKKIRSVMTTLMFSGYALGGILAAWLGKQLIGEHGWQSVFIAADARFVLPSSDRAGGVPIVRLFQDGRGLSTVMFWIAFFTGLFMIYALSSWLTKLMAMSGYSLGSALSFVIALNVGAMVGAIGGGWLADKFHIKWVLVAMYALGGVFLTMMTVKMPVEWLYLVIAAVGACSTGAQIVAYAYCGQFYPMAIRSSGIGMAAGIGRTGAIAAPLLIGLIVSLKLPLEQNFLVIGAAGVVGAIALAFIDHKRSASVEHAAATSPAAAAQQPVGAAARA